MTLLSSYCIRFCKFFKDAWDNFTWFSMVAMNGEQGDRKFRNYMNTRRRF